MELSRDHKLSFLSRFNLDLKNSGHSEGFRNSMTKQSIAIYDRMMTEKPDLFRTREEIMMASRTRPGNTDWFKKSGEVDVILNIPPTLNQELLIAVRNTVTKID